MHCLRPQPHDGRLASSRGLARPALRPCRAVAPPAADREQKQQQEAASTATAAAPPAPAPATTTTLTTPDVPANQSVREGSYESPLVSLQAGKADPEQPPLAQLLPELAPSSSVDVVVAGCGPAGLFLASELASRGISVGLVGPDVPFVNNYGVWLDEFDALGLRHTIERAYEDAVCFFGEGAEKRVGRGYGRVGRRALRAHLAKLCADAGVRYMPGEVEAAPVVEGGEVEVADVQVRRRNGGSSSSAGDSCRLSARLVVLASGAAAGRLLRYEQGAPRCAAQTAYGVEADVEGYDDAYDPKAMLFMDYRRHHTGLWEGGAKRLSSSAAAKSGGKQAAAAAGGLPLSHPNAADGLWDSEREVPSFLYAMPLDDGPTEEQQRQAAAAGSNGNGNGASTPTPTTRRVFLEETCLVAKPALPFAVLKRRLQRRLDAMGVRVVRVREEEWSYIPVGGPLPVGDQPVVAFGAAANLVHPATGFSVSRSLREAPAMADAVVEALKLEQGPGSVRRAARRVWRALWPDERRRQAAFHLFGMELLAQLDLSATNSFFRTFFALPDKYWRGFLASRLSSGDLVAFALVTFVLAPLDIKARLVTHLLLDPAGKYLADKYLGGGADASEEVVGEGAVAAGSGGSSSSSSAGASVV